MFAIFGSIFSQLCEDSLCDLIYSYSFLHRICVMHLMVRIISVRKGLVKNFFCYFWGKVAKKVYKSRMLLGKRREKCAVYGRLGDSCQCLLQGLKKELLEVTEGEKSFQTSCKIFLHMIKLYGEYTEEVQENGKGVYEKAGQSLGCG